MSVRSILRSSIRIAPKLNSQCKDIWTKFWVKIKLIELRRLTDMVSRI